MVEVTTKNPQKDAPVRRPNRRLQRNQNSLTTLTSSMAEASLTSSTTTSQTLSSSGTSFASRRSFSSSLRDRRGLSSTGGSVKLSFVEAAGLDQASMRHILGGFDSDSDCSEGSEDSFLEELRNERKKKEEGDANYSGRGSLKVIESGSSMKFDADEED